MTRRSVGVVRRSARPRSSRRSTIQVAFEAFAEHQPVSVTASAARALMIETPSDSYLLQALLWIAGIIAVAAPFAVRR